MKRRLTKMLAVVAVLSVMTLGMTLNAFAADSWQNSQGSSATDTTAGVDTTQGKQTEYTDDTVHKEVYTTTSTVETYITRVCTVKYEIPQVLVGDAGTNTSSYSIGVKGDIAANQKISIGIPESYELTGLSGQKATATISQGKTSWTYDEIDPTEFTKTTGTITYTLPSAGVYHGGFNFTVTVGLV